jgi:hypothetical protein
MDRHEVRTGIRRRASARHVRLPTLAWLFDGHTLAILLGVLAALGLIGATLSFVVDLFVAPWRLYTSDLEESLHLLASVVCLAGAFRLSRSAYQAKHLVLAGLALNVVATLVFSSASLGRPDTLVPLLTWVGLAALTVAAKVSYP